MLGVTVPIAEVARIAQLWFPRQCDKVELSTGVTLILVSVIMTRSKFDSTGSRPNFHSILIDSFVCYSVL